MNRSEAGLIGARIAKKINHEKKLKRIDGYNKDPNLCKRCKKPLDYEQRKNFYCSHSCSASSNNLGICRKERKPIQICLNCEKRFKSCAEYFCSIKCGNDYKWKKWCKKVEKIGLFEGYGAKDSGGRVSKPKKYLLEKQNGKCVLCGINEWMGKPVPFVLDHIDGDPSNWKISNTRVICRNCDGQLDTYCGKNIKRKKPL